jgi:hypothetical protein
MTALAPISTLAAHGGGTLFRLRGRQARRNSASADTPISRPVVIASMITVSLLLWWAVVASAIWAAGLIF